MTGADAAMAGIALGFLIVTIGFPVTYAIVQSRRQRKSKASPKRSPHRLTAADLPEGYGLMHRVLPNGNAQACAIWEGKSLGLNPWTGVSVSLEWAISRSVGDAIRHRDKRLADIDDKTIPWTIEGDSQ